MSDERDDDLPFIKMIDTGTNPATNYESTRADEKSSRSDHRQASSLQELLEVTTAWRPYPLFITLSMSFLWSLCALSAISPAFTAADVTCSNPENCTFYSIHQEFNFSHPSLIDPAEMTSSIYFLGNLVIGQFFATLADRFGRRPIVIGALFIAGISGCLGSVAPTFSLFLLSRFVQGACYTPLTTVNYVLSGESIPTQSTSLVSMFFGFAWVFGYCALAPLSSWFNTWRRLQFATSVPNIIFGAILLPLIPESIAYSIQCDNRASVQKWIRRNEQISCIRIEHNIDEIMKSSKLSEKGDDDDDAVAVAVKNSSIRIMMRRILKDGKIVKRMLLETTVWILTFMTYCGLSLTSTTVGSSDPQISFLFSGIVELPAYIVTPIALKWTRRIPMRVICHFLGGIALFTLFFLSPESPAHLPIWLIAKFSAACCYIFCFIYASELFPTYCRTCCIGVCSTFCNLGAIVAPHIFVLDSVLHSSQFLLLSFSSAVAIFLILLQPETKKPTY